MIIRNELLYNFLANNMMSVNEFSNLTHIHRATIMSVLNGKNISLKSACKFAKVFNINVMQLFR